MIGKIPFAEKILAQYIVKFDYDGILTITKDDKEIYDYCISLKDDKKVKAEILITIYENGEKEIVLKSILKE